MTLCPECQASYEGWLRYTPPAYQNRYIQTWREAVGGYLGDRSREIQDANRRKRRDLVNRQLDLIVARCAADHQ